MMANSDVSAALSRSRIASPEQLTRKALIDNVWHSWQRGSAGELYSVAVTFVANVVAGAEDRRKKEKADQMIRPF